MDSPSSISPSSSPQTLATTNSVFSYCNDLNSYFVANANCVQTLDALANILSAHNEEIEFAIDAKSQSIEGFVFLSNICVHFVIYVVAQNEKQCRFEFRRTSGSAMAAAKFWNDLQALYRQHNESQNKEQQFFNFIALEPLRIECNELKQEKFDKSELDELCATLLENNVFVVDELTFLYEEMAENESICCDVLRHRQFMGHLINESTQNTDICVVRIALLILQKLAATNGNKLCCMAEIGLFCKINLVLQHKQQLIRKCALTLLANLCNDCESEWNISDELRPHMMQNVEKCANECNADMVKKITA